MSSICVVIERGREKEATVVVVTKVDLAILGTHVFVNRGRWPSRRTTRTAPLEPKCHEHVGMHLRGDAFAGDERGLVWGAGLGGWLVTLVLLRRWYTRRPIPAQEAFANTRRRTRIRLDFRHLYHVVSRSPLVAHEQLRSGLTA